MNRWHNIGRAQYFVLFSFYVNASNVIEGRKSALIGTRDLSSLLNSPLFMFIGKLTIYIFWCHSQVDSLLQHNCSNITVFELHDYILWLIDVLRDWKWSYSFTLELSIFVSSKVNFLRLDFINRFRDIRSRTFKLDLRLHILSRVDDT